MSPLYTFLFILITAFAILFGLFIHELGHFTFAKLFKVNVKEFSIGIGPKIFSKKYNRTVFCLRPIPVMAYVVIDSKKIIGMYKELADEQLKEINEYKLKFSNDLNLNNDRKYKKMMKDYQKYVYMSTLEKDKLIIDDIQIWKQLLVYFGGVLFNLAFFLIFFLITQFGLTSLVQTIDKIYADRYNNPNFHLNTNVFDQLKNVFINLGKNMVFYNAWGTGSSSSGTIIGETITISQIDPPQEYLNYIMINYFCIFNLVLFAFNLLPIPPLDGFKILLTLMNINGKIIITKKVENIITFIGLGLMVYIMFTGIIADILIK